MRYYPNHDKLLFAIAIGFSSFIIMVAGFAGCVAWGFRVLGK